MKTRLFWIALGVWLALSVAWTADSQVDKPEPASICETTTKLLDHVGRQVVAVGIVTQNEHGLYLSPDCPRGRFAWTALKEIPNGVFSPVEYAKAGGKIGTGVHASVRGTIIAWFERDSHNRKRVYGAVQPTEIRFVVASRKP